MRISGGCSRALWLIVSVLTRAWCWGQNWVPNNAPYTNWQALASSADGSRLIAAARPGLVYISADSGTNWNATSLPWQYWQSVASSAFGSNLLAAAENDFWISHDSGLTWIVTNPFPGEVGEALTCSADGAVLLASGPGVLYRSDSFGGFWVPTPAPAYEYRAAACSANSQVFIVAGCLCGLMQPGPILVSTNAGRTWTNTSLLAWDWSYNCVSCSADGRILAAVYQNQLYRSTDTGVTWIPITLQLLGVRSLRMSADGTRIVLFGDQVYSSVDSGMTWAVNSTPSGSLSCYASSADGTRLAAASNGGTIYVSQSTPQPMLNLQPADGSLLVSWLIPSCPFILERSGDLSDWQSVAAPPVFNFSKLQYETQVAPTNSRALFRLRN